MNSITRIYFRKIQVDHSLTIITGISWKRSVRSRSNRLHDHFQWTTTAAHATASCTNCCCCHHHLLYHPWHSRSESSPCPQQQPQHKLFPTTTRCFSSATKQEEEDPFRRVAPYMKKRIQKLRHHAKFGNIAKAEQEFDQIWKLQSERTDYGRLQFEDIVWECIRCIIRGCTRRLRVRAPKAKNADTIQNLVGFANRLFEGGKSNFPESTNNNKFRKRCIGALIELYSRAKKFSDMEQFLKGPDVDSWVLNRALIELGKRNQPEIATSLFQKTLQDKFTSSLVRIEMFHSLLYAWNKTSRHEAFHNAWQVLCILKEDPTCIQLRLRPDTSLYGAVLKCLTTSTTQDAGRKAIEILGEMDRASQNGDQGCKPDDICYSLAIKACLQSDHTLVDGLLVRMEQAGCPPDVRTYNGIMSHWSKTKTKEAAERTERIIAKMKMHTATFPDVISFNIVLAAWARMSNDDSDSIAKMWSTFEQMLSDNIQPDQITMNTLIAYLTRTRVIRFIQKADNLLLTMEKMDGNNLRPDNLHFSSVIRGWLSVGEIDNARAVLERSAHAYIKAKNRSALKDTEDLKRILQAYSKRGYVGKATGLFEEFLDFYKTGSLPFGPDFDTHVSLLAEWKKQLDHPEQKTNIEKLEASMESLPLQKKNVRKPRQIRL